MISLERAKKFENLTADVVGKNSIDIRFELEDSESSQSSVPENSVSPNVAYNSIPHKPHRIHLKKIGGGVRNTLEVQDVPENNIILELEGSESLPSFVPFDYVVSGQKSSRSRGI
jgi:hypothetical protein